MKRKGTIVYDRLSSPPFPLHQHLLDLRRLATKTEIGLIHARALKKGKKRTLSARPPLSPSPRYRQTS